VDEGEGRRRLLDLLGGQLDPGRRLHLAHHVAGGAGLLRVVGQQAEQRRLPRGGLGQDGGDPVEPLELGGPLGLAEGLVGLESGPLVADQERDHLEADALGAALLYAGLDLARGLGEDRHDADLVAGPPTARRPVTLARAGAALATGRHLRPPPGRRNR